MLWFGAPIVIPALLSTAWMAGTGSKGSEFTGIAWAVGLAFVPVAFVCALVFHIRYRSDLGNGALTACALGFLVLAGTCATNIVLG